jgi:sulfatase modifying factor 1
MKTCPSCQQTYSDDVESCPQDGSKLIAEFRDERECPYCAELILKKAQVCKHCHRDVEPLTGSGTSQPSAPTLGIPEARKSQPQATRGGTSAGRPTAASNTPWLRVKPEPPSRMKFILLGGTVLILVVAGVWYFSHRKTQPSQMAKENAKVGEAVLTAGTVRENAKDGLKYIWIPPGTFMMGCSPGDNECRDDEKPAHQVTISKGFWIGQTEVTVGAYKRFAGMTGRQMPYAPYYDEQWADANMPMTDVMWNEAHDYCGWMGGRLPTEAEWEYAARGGSRESRYGNIDEIAWYGGNSGNRAHEAAQKRSNGFGLYDMLGNLGEYVNDWYDPHYYQNSPLQDPTGPPSGYWHVSRGGFYLANTVVPTVSMRMTGEAGRRQDMGGWGFRCAGESLPTAAGPKQPGEDDRTQMQSEAALVQALINQHKDFAVCRIQELEYHKMNPGRCTLPQPYCDNMSRNSEFQALKLLDTVGYIGDAEHPTTAQVSTGTYYWSPTDRGSKALGTEIKQETLAKWTNGEVAYKWTLILGCREFDQLDATTQLADGLKVDFSWHWKLTTLGNAAKLSDKRQRGMAYLTKKAEGLALDQIDMK